MRAKSLFLADLRCFLPLGFFFLVPNPEPESQNVSDPTERPRFKESKIVDKRIYLNYDTESILLFFDFVTNITNLIFSPKIMLFFKYFIQG